MVTVTRKGSQTMEEVRKALLIEIGLRSINALVTEDEVTFKKLNRLLKEQRATALEDYIKIKEINADEIEKDPYIEAFKKVKFNNEIQTLKDSGNNYRIVGKSVLGNMVCSNNRRFTRKSLAKYEEDQRASSSLITTISYCYTGKTLFLPVLYEGLTKKDPWMTVEPYEILTHNTRAKYVKGSVLLLGCGLGYTAFRLAQEDQVENIDIVELSPDVKKLYDDNIRDITPNNHKINEVILADAIEYLYTTNLEKYNHIDVDIWRDTLDMTYPYLKCLALEERYSNVKFSYWIENSFYNNLQTEILRILYKRFYRIEKDLIADDIPIPGLDILAEYIVDNERVMISSTQVLLDFISYPNLRRIVKNFAINNSEGVERIKKHIESKLKELDELIIEASIIEASKSEFSI